MQQSVWNSLFYLVIAVFFTHALRTPSDRRWVELSSEFHQREVSENGTLAPHSNAARLRRHPLTKRKPEPMGHSDITSHQRVLLFDRDSQEEVNKKDKSRGIEKQGQLPFRRSKQRLKPLKVDFTPMEWDNVNERHGWADPSVLEYTTPTGYVGEERLRNTTTNFQVSLQESLKAVEGNHIISSATLPSANTNTPVGHFLPEFTPITVPITTKYVNSLVTSTSIPLDTGNGTQILEMKPLKSKISISSSTSSRLQEMKVPNTLTYALSYHESMDHSPIKLRDKEDNSTSRTGRSAPPISKTGEAMDELGAKADSENSSVLAPYSTSKNPIPKVVANTSNSNSRNKLLRYYTDLLNNTSQLKELENSISILKSNASSHANATAKANESRKNYVTNKNYSHKSLPKKVPLTSTYHHSTVSDYSIGANTRSYSLDPSKEYTSRISTHTPSRSSLKYPLEVSSDYTTESPPVSLSEEIISDITLPVTVPWKAQNIPDELMNPRELVMDSTMLSLEVNPGVMTQSPSFQALTDFVKPFNNSNYSEESKEEITTQSFADTNEVMGILKNGTFRKEFKDSNTEDQFQDRTTLSLAALNGQQSLEPRSSFGEGKFETLSNYGGSLEAIYNEFIATNYDENETSPPPIYKFVNFLKKKNYNAGIEEDWRNLVTDYSSEDSSYQEPTPRVEKQNLAFLHFLVSRRRPNEKWENEGTMTVSPSFKALTGFVKPDNVRIYSKEPQKKLTTESFPNTDEAMGILKNGTSQKEFRGSNAEDHYQGGTEELEQVTSPSSLAALDVLPGLESRSSFGQDKSETNYNGSLEAIYNEILETNINENQTNVPPIFKFAAFLQKRNYNAGKEDWDTLISDYDIENDLPVYQEPISRIENPELKFLYYLERLGKENEEGLNKDPLLTANSSKEREAHIVAVKAASPVPTTAGTSTVNKSSIEPAIVASAQVFSPSGNNVISSSTIASLTESLTGVTNSQTSAVLELSELEKTQSPLPSKSSEPLLDDGQDSNGVSTVESAFSTIANPFPTSVIDNSNFSSLPSSLSFMTDPTILLTDRPTSSTKPPTSITDSSIFFMPVTEPQTARTDPPTVIDPPTTMPDPPTTMTDPPATKTGPPTTMIAPPKSLIDPPTSMTDPSTSTIDSLKDTTGSIGHVLIFPTDDIPVSEILFHTTPVESSTLIPSESLPSTSFPMADKVEGPEVESTPRKPHDHTPLTISSAIACMALLMLFIGIAVVRKSVKDREKSRFLVRPRFSRHF